jgi:hypothetical protein
MNILAIKKARYLIYYIGMVNLSIVRTVYSLQFIFFLQRNISCQAKLCRAIVTTPNAAQKILLKDLTGRKYQRRLFKSIGG